ncbi:MAG TPA: peptidase M14, partial [Arenimonas sp.]|nr:peptidase M14 [Arenimonas sp.]
MRTLLCLLLVAAAPALATPPPLGTVSEASGFTHTGRYDEVVKLCDEFARAYPAAVRCLDFGTTPQGRPMKALVASTRGALDPAAAREKNLPVVLVQGGIHAGEI